MYTKEERAAWRKANPEKLREYENRATARARGLILQMLGGACVVCGIDDIRVLQVDHIMGGGNKMRKETKTTHTTRGLLAYLRKNGTDEFQLLCANHNWIKRYENGEVNQYAIQVRETA
jgi:hypothetical protein